MSFIRIGYQEGSCFTCSDGGEVDAGQDILVYLDPDRFSNVPENPFPAIITAITTADASNSDEANFDKVYVAEFDDAYLPTGVLEIKTCDLDLSNPPECKICMSNCELEEAVIALQNASPVVSSVSFVENAPTGVITMTVTDSAGGTVVSVVEDSTLTLDASGNLVNPAGTIMIPAGVIVDTQYVSNADGTTTVTVDGVALLTTTLDTNTTYTFNADGTVTDSNGVAQDVSVLVANVVGLDPQIISVIQGAVTAGSITIPASALTGLCAEITNCITSDTGTSSAIIALIQASITSGAITIVDNDTTYTFNANGTVTDSNGVIQNLPAGGGTDTNTTYTFNANGTVTDSDGGTQTLPIELPIIFNQASHLVADANTAIASGQRYTLTLDRAIYIKP